MEGVVRSGSPVTNEYEHKRRKLIAENNEVLLKYNLSQLATHLTRNSKRVRHTPSNVQSEPADSQYVPEFLLH